MGAYDVNSEVTGYGDPGAAAYRGMQTELMRRLQLQAQADAVTRQNKLDATNEELKRETIANTKLNNQSLADQRAATVKKETLASATLGLSPNDVLDDSTASTIKNNGGGGLLLGKPATPAMTMGVPTQFAEPPADAAAASEAPVTPAQAAQMLYKGTAKDQEDEAHKKFAQTVVDSLKAKQENGDTLTPVEQEALFQGNSILMTGKSATVPAGVIVPKVGPAEKSADKYLAVATKAQKGEPLDADEKAFKAAYETQHPTEAQKQQDSIQRLHISVDATGARQDKSLTFQTKQQFRKELTDTEKKLDTDLERSDRALALLDKPNFVTDAVAGPEFLQIVAGGMGSGLRMTDAELRRVNEAQSKIDQFKGYLAKWDVLGMADKVTIQKEMRTQMKAALEAVHAARQRKAKLAADTLNGIGDAMTPEDLDSLHAKYWEDRSAPSMGMGGGGAATGQKKVYNPATGKVELQ